MYEYCDVILEILVHLQSYENFNLSYLQAKSPSKYNELHHFMARTSCHSGPCSGSTDPAKPAQPVKFVETMDSEDDSNLPICGP